ncbi:CidA/LrgA family protein [Tistrella mobilis]|uniref:CidA/LrgA family protein n=1 Tax=Tistrella mobilis TaxID=171437 RepID=UPI00355914BA
MATGWKKAGAVCVGMVGFGLACMAGSWLSAVTGIGLPGQILAVPIVLAVLAWLPAARRPIEAAGDVLLPLLGLFLIPPATRALQAMVEDPGRLPGLLLAIGLTLPVTVAVTVGVFTRLRRQPPIPAAEHGARGHD